MGPVERRWRALVDDPTPWSLRGATWALAGLSRGLGAAAYYTGRAEIWCRDMADQIRWEDERPPDVKG